MKTFLKVLKITSLVFVTLLILLMVAGWIMQDRIAKMAIERVSETLDAPLDVEKVKFSLIKDFPLASIEFDGFWIGARQSDSLSGTMPIDTLAKIGRLFFSLDTKDLLDDIFTVKKIEAMDGYIKYYVDSTGATNYDFLLASDTTIVVDSTEVTGPPLIATIHELTVKNMTCLYQDDQLKAGVRLFIPKVTVTAHLDSVTMQATALGGVEFTNLRFDGTQLDRMEKANLYFNLSYDADTLVAKTMKLQTDGLTLESSGRVAMGESIYTDLALNIQAPDLAKLTKYIPDDIMDDNQVSELSGGINITTKIKGMVTDETLPHYEATFELTNGNVKWQDYPSVQNVTLKGVVNNGSLNANSTTSIVLDLFSFDFSGNHMELKGNFRDLDHLNYEVVSDLAIDFTTSKPFIPDTLVSHISGKMDVHLETKGILPDSIDDQFIETLLDKTLVNVQFKQVDLDMDSVISLRGFSAQIGYKSRRLDVKNLNMRLPEYDQRLVGNAFQAHWTGSVSKPERLNVEVPYFYLATPESSIRGSASIRDLKHVVFSVQSNLEIDLAYAKRFAPDSMVNEMTGKIWAKIRSAGKINLDSISDQIENILYDQSAFDIKMKDITLDMTDTLMNVEKLSGHIIIRDHSVNIQKLSGVYSGIDFAVDTTSVKNFVNTAIRNQPGTMEIYGTYSFGDLDYAILGALAAGGEASDSTSIDTETAAEPTLWSYEIKGKVDIRSVKYDNITLKGLTAQYDINSTTNEIKGKFGAKSILYDKALLEDVTALYNFMPDTTFTIDQLKYKAFDGNINSSIKIKMKENDEMLIQMKAQVEKMNVRNLLRDMDNLYQDEITYENMSGIATTDNFFLQMRMIGDSLVYPDMRMSMDIKFENGGIYQYPVVQDMAQYLPSVDNLDTLAFKTIRSNIFIFQDAIYIPETFIVTSAFDVHMLGKQSFGEDYQYHIGVNFGEILKGKSEKKEEKQATMGDDLVDAERKFTWLKSTGRNGKYTNGFDKGDARSQMIKDIKEAQALLKLRFIPKRFKFETNVAQ